MLLKSNVFQPEKKKKVEDVENDNIDSEVVKSHSRKATLEKIKQKRGNFLISQNSHEELHLKDSKNRIERLRETPDHSADPEQSK